MKRALPAVAAIVLLAAACGGVENEPNLAAAAERTRAAGSSRFALTVVQAVGGHTQTFTCEGSADYAAKRVRLRCGDEGEFVAIGDAFYLRVPLFAGATADKPWLRLLTEPNESPSPHDLAPEILLEKIRAASLETERIGSEDVRGQRTVRYRMTVRCEDVDFECEAETTDVEAWVDDSGLVRRVAFEDSGADVRAEYFDFGVPVEVEEPPPSQVSEPSDPTRGPCAGGAEPISAERLRKALRRSGYADVASDLDECPPGMAASVVAVERADVAGGPTLCHVQAVAGAGAPRSVERRSSSASRRSCFRTSSACSTTARPSVPAARSTRSHASSDRRILPWPGRGTTRSFSACARSWPSERSTRSSCAHPTTSST